MQVLVFVLGITNVAAAQPAPQGAGAGTAQEPAAQAAPHRRPTRSNTSSSASRSRASTSTTGTAPTTGSICCVLTTRGPMSSAFNRRRSSWRVRLRWTRVAGSAPGSICSSDRQQRRSRAARRTSRGRMCIATSGRPTARTSSRVGRGLQTDFGKFASNLGYETNYAKDNNHFSRAYLFNFLPFYHSGLRVRRCRSATSVTLMYMLTNGIQQTEDFNDFKSNHFTAIVKPVGQRDLDDELLLRSGAVGCVSSRTARTGSSACSTPTSPTRRHRELSFGLDVNYVTNEVNKADDALSHCRAPACMRAIRCTDPAALSVRYERLDDEGLFGGIEQVLHEVTATAGVQVRRRLPAARRVPPRLVEPRRSSLVRRPERPARLPEHRARSAWCGGSATSTGAW